MLASIMPQYTAAKRKVAKISRIQISKTRRRDQPSQQPPSPKSFVSPELVEVLTPESEIPPLPIQPRISTESEEPEPELDEAQVQNTRETVSSLPRVQFEISPGSLSDWSDLFSSEKFNFDDAIAQSLLGSVRNETQSASASEPSQISGSTVAGYSKTANTFKGGPQRDQRRVTVITNSHSREPPERMENSVDGKEESIEDASSFWKPYPTPLEIPDRSFDDVEFQNTLGTYSVVDAFPRSAVTDSPSPVNGAILARALIANGYHLSGHAPHPSTSTRRISAVTRADSTVLPDGDTLEWQNPLAMDTHHHIPPVPPIPSHLLPHGDKFHPKPDRTDILSASSHSKDSDHTNSLGSILASYVNSSPLTAEFFERQQGNMDVQILRRLSSITEPPPEGFTSMPSTPPLLGVPSDSRSDIRTRAGSSKSNHSGSSSPALNVANQQSTPSRQREPNESHFSFTTIDDHEAGEPDITGSPRIPAVSPPTSDNGSITSHPGSPPSSQWNDHFDPQNRRRGSKVVLGMTMSPSGEGGKVDWLIRNRSGSLGDNQPSRSVTLLPIGERPRSFNSSASNSSIDSRSALSAPFKSPASTTATESLMRSRSVLTIVEPSGSVPDPAALQIPTISRAVFNRQRTGGTPSPLAIDRGSKDLDAYSITVAGSTPGLNVPMFPETPREFSPMWSANSVASPLRAEVNELLNSISPTDLSRTASFYATGAGTVSIAQQVLLSRAATSVRGARVAGMSRPRVIHPYARNVPLLTPPAEDPAGEDTPVSPKPESPTRLSLQLFEFPRHPEEAADTAPLSPKPPTPPQSTAAPTVNDTSSLSQTQQVSNDSQNGFVQSEDVSLVKPLPPRPRGSLSANVVLTPGQRMESSIPTPESVTLPTQNNLPPDFPGRSSPSDPATATTTSPSTSPLPVQQQPQPHVDSPTPSEQLGSSIRPTPGRSEKGDSFLTRSFTLSIGAPPPYYAVVPGTPHTDGVLPTPDLEPPLSQGSGNSSPGYTEFRSPATSPPHTGDSILTTGDSSSPRNRVRTRPRLPAGPRNPVPHPAAVQPTRPPGTSGNGNVANVGSSTSSSYVPKFQSPPMKWRGYTMDAAKWTFTSEQLQDIVSRAIKQSAEAYSIRLLRLETLDNDIPDEMHRLEMLGTDVKSRYKVLVRKRQGLLQSLATHLDAPKTDLAAGRRLLEELSETSMALDRLAEELHSVDEQIANLRSVRDVHSASALAMALRKLNGSFLRQVAETQALRQHIEFLEHERDDAWKHAEDVAHDFDEFTEKVLESNNLQTPISTKPNSRRSSRVLAVRKSSVRALKAGLRPSRSQRSSVSSLYRASLSPLASSKNVLTAEDIPPVPPIPLPTPLGIETNLPSRSSMGASTGTPSTETRAMVDAQNELYALLGISPLETGGLQRRRTSMFGPSVPLESSASSSFEAKARLGRALYRPRSAGSAVVTL